MRWSLAARPVSMEGATVRRALPRSERRMVGPFIFLDHMGPMTLDPGAGFDVRPHPHIGLSTLTYLYRGTVVHRDSLGVVQPIAPGEVNWMTAGRGVVHSERLDPQVRAQGQALHGLQLWVALPVEAEDMPPRFEHHRADALPGWSSGGAQFTLVAGAGWGRESPVQVSSPLVLADVSLSAAGAVDVGSFDGELAAYVVEGSVHIEQTDYPEGTLVLLEHGDVLAADAPTRVALLGGQPFPQRRFIDWNFVASEPARLAAARQRWIDRGFDPVPGDDERVPHPSER